MEHISKLGDYTSTNNFIHIERLLYMNIGFDWGNDKKSVWFKLNEYDSNGGRLH